MRSSNHPQVDEMLLEWYQSKRGNNNRISGSVLRAKAEEFGRMIGDNFKCSSGWLDRFRKRHDIVFGRNYCESMLVDKNITDEWTSQLWSAISSDYSYDDIFRVEEVGVFYRLLPDKIDLLVKSCDEERLPKELITVLVCANISGTEKRKLLAIGKFKNLESSNVKTLPVDYYANNGAKMTPSIFIDYLKKWDDKLIRSNRKILLLVDKSPSNSDLVLNNIKLQLFPPNPLSVLQSADQEIVWSLKDIYTNQLSIKNEALQENNVSTKPFSISDVMNLLSLAWESVSLETIRNCFRRVGLLKKATEKNNVDTSSSEFAKINDLQAPDDFMGYIKVENNVMEVSPEEDNNLQDMDKFSNYIKVENIGTESSEVEVNHLQDLDKCNDFIKIETNVTGGDSFSSNLELINGDLNEAQDSNSDLLEDINEGERKAVTIEEALDCVQKLRRYFRQEKDTNTVTLLELNRIQIALQNDYARKKCSIENK